MGYWEGAARENPMSVSSVGSTGTWSWVYNQQTPATSKAQAVSDANVATQVTQEASQAANDQQAITRGNSEGINKLA
jgi:hypothetical protein